MQGGKGGAMGFGRSKAKMMNELKGKKFAKSTLGGCIIEERDSFVLITKELKTKKSEMPSYKVRF